MHLKKILLKFMLLVLLSPLNSYAKKIGADDIVGLWLSEKKDGVIEVKKEDGDYKGYLVWIKVLAEGKEKVVLDFKNPDSTLQKRNLLGLKLLEGFTFDDGVWRSGSIYDPDSGKTYKCKLSLAEDKETLNLRGYVGIPLFGRTSHWTRIKTIPQL